MVHSFVFVCLLVVSYIATFLRKHENLDDDDVNILGNGILITLSLFVFLWLPMEMYY